MKKILFLLLTLIVPLLTYSQSLDSAIVIDWRFIVEDVTYINDSTWEIKAIPEDTNDPGAETREIGNYVDDNIGNTYKVISSTAMTLTVVDLQFTGYPTAPQASQLAKCYLSVLNGDPRFGSAGGINFFPLDEQAKWPFVAKNIYELAKAIDNIDVTQSGTSIGVDTIIQVAHGLTLGDWIRNNTGSYTTAQGNTAINADVLGVVSEVISVDTFIYQYAGMYRSGTWADGTNYFLSTTVAGDTSSVQEYEDGDVYVYLGVGTDEGLLIEIDVGIVISIDETETNSYYYEDYLITGEDEINVGFSLSASSLVFLNGNIVMSDYFSYSTSTLTLNFDILESDMLVVWNTGGAADAYYEDYLTEAENNIDIGFTLASSSLVFFNGNIIMSDMWSGEGTQILTLALTTKLYDKITIKN